MDVQAIVLHRVYRPTDAKEILEQFASLRALVIGDVALDVMCRYRHVSRPQESTPQTGLLPITVREFDPNPGGAANVASNVKSSGPGR